MLKIIWPQKEKYLKKRYTCRACPFQFQETKVLGKHLELVQPCLGIKVIIFDPKRPWLVYQLRALQLVNWSVTKLRLVQRITFFNLNWSLAEPPSRNRYLVQTNIQTKREVLEEEIHLQGVPFSISRNKSPGKTPGVGSAMPWHKSNHLWPKKAMVSLSTQGAAARELICYKVTPCSKNNFFQPQLIFGWTPFTQQIRSSNKHTNKKN